MLKLTHSQSAYLAGFIDGDGSIYVRLKPNNDYRYGFQIAPYIILFQSAQDEADFQKILSQHVEFYDAMLRLQSRRIRQLFGLVEDLNTLPLRSRLAKQLLHLARSYGVPSLSNAQEIRIGLQLAQEELAQLLGASRQRVNQELKAMEREEAIRIEAGGLVIRNREALLRISEADH